MRSSKKKQALRERIEQAFDDAEYPGDDDLVVTDDDWEAAEIKAWLKGKHWRDLSLDALYAHNGAVWVLTPSAYRYYLPSYLLASLEDSPDTVYDSLLAALAPPPYGLGSPDQFAERVEALNALQRDAIRSFFRDAATDYDDLPDYIPNHCCPTYGGGG